MVSVIILQFTVHYFLVGISRAVPTPYDNGLALSTGCTQRLFDLARLPAGNSSLPPPPTNIPRHRFSGRVSPVAPNAATPVLKTSSPPSSQKIPIPLYIAKPRHA